MKRIEIDDVSEQILALDMVDPEEWLTGFVRARLQAVVQSLVSSDQWTGLVVEASKANIEVSNANAVVSFGIQQGMLKTAAQRQAEHEAARQTGIEPVDDSLNVEHVRQHAMTLKMGLVNAPTLEAFKDILDNGTREGLRLMRIKDQRDWTEGEALRAAELERFDLVIDHIDKAATLITVDVETGKIAESDALRADERWLVPNE